MTFWLIDQYGLGYNEINEMPYNIFLNLINHKKEIEDIKYKNTMDNLKRQEEAHKKLKAKNEHSLRSIRLSQKGKK